MSTHASNRKWWEKRWERGSVLSPIHRLTALSVKSASGPARLADGGGLYLYVSRSGKKSWVYRFRWGARRKEHGLGSIRDLSLAEVREAAEAARLMVRRGINPIFAKKASRCSSSERGSAPRQMTFGEFADAYVAALRTEPKTIGNWRRTVEVYAADIRGKPLGDVTTDDILGVLTPLLAKTPAAGAKAISYLGKIFAAAKTRKIYIGDNPAVWDGHLSTLIEKPKPLASQGHRRALPIQDLPAFFRELRGYNEDSAKALMLLILTAARPRQAAGARWDEFDLERKVWGIPAERMKARRSHRVALSDLAVELVVGLRRQGRDESPFVFLGTRPDTHLNPESLRRHMQRMGVGGDVATAHGFRSTFCDWVGDHSDFDTDLAFQALSHAPVGAVAQAYRRGDALELRFELMNAWADYCAGIIPLAKRAG